jgi:hypothetical protein
VSWSKSLLHMLKVLIPTKSETKLSRARPTQRGTCSEGSLNAVPEDSVVDELGIDQGSELVFYIFDRQNTQQNLNQNNVHAQRHVTTGTTSDLFFSANNDGCADKIFHTLLSVLENQ